MKSNILKIGLILVPVVILFMILARMDSQTIVEYVTYKQPSDELIPKLKPMLSLNATELGKVQMCAQTSKSNWRKEGFNSPGRDVHQIAHTYLTDQSLVIEVGGNVGDDANAILRKFKPKQYIILEPVERHYRGLINKFRNHSSVLIYNFGLGKENAIFNVRLKGHHQEGTSIFTQHGKNVGGEKLRIVNATEFFLSSGVGIFEVDLLSINCEGCEYDLLEVLTETTLVLQFKYIQFQPHVQYKGVGDVAWRYCRIRQLLSRTHSIVYEYSYIWVWEMWRRNDLKPIPW